LTEISLCNVCSCQEILRCNGRGQECKHLEAELQEELNAFSLQAKRELEALKLQHEMEE
jgi:hypothetical protein